MELSPGILDSIDITEDKDVMEVLKQAAVSEEDIIFESEATEDSEEAEVEEIIEIIEEIEESEESLEDYTSNSLSENKDAKLTADESYEDDAQPNQYNKNCATEIYTFDEENSMFKSQYTQQETSKSANDSSQKNSSKQVITYDVDEDWQDDDIEHMEDIDEELEQDLLNQEAESSQKHGVSSEGGKSVSNDAQGYLLQSNKQESRNMTESSVKIDRSRVVQEYGSNIVNARNTNINVTQEIVKNAENNLVYTVLGSKKQANAKQLQAEKVPDAHYIKNTRVLQMEQLDENTIPVEGTIYYEGDNMETLYVAQAVDENDQYRYSTDTLIQDEQTWKQTDGETNQNQDEENSQDQIFLHEDEDGQLYFKDDSGALQPVYLTEDGNYAIAENSDDQDSKESQEQSQDAGRQPDEFIIPEIEMNSNASNKQTAVVPASALQELENEDNTVTISLIISEDEHGQKRTQVIIPTTDSMKCDICNKSFKTSFQLLRHNRLKHAREEDITTRNFPCDLCPKRYPDQNSLARHRKTHTGDRPFQCLECHKNFPTSTALRRHLTLHNSQSRPLPCIYCGRRFVEKANLIKHEQSHLPTDQRTHTCDVCQKSFLHATDLSLHKKYHDPDKKFDCEVCGREFNRLNNLQRHMMVHQQQGASEEILSCDVCGITYKFMSSLTRHMVTTHMNPEKLRQQAEEQRRKRENNYRRYLENRKMYETQHSGGYNAKRSYHHNARILTGNNDDAA